MIKIVLVIMQLEIMVISIELLKLSRLVRGTMKVLCEVFLKAEEEVNGQRETD